MQMHRCSNPAAPGRGVPSGPSGLGRNRKTTGRVVYSPSAAPRPAVAEQPERPARSTVRPRSPGARPGAGRHHDRAAACGRHEYRRRRPRQTVRMTAQPPVRAAPDEKSELIICGDPSECRGFPNCPARSRHVTSAVRGDLPDPVVRQRNSSGLNSSGGHPHRSAVWRLRHSGTAGKRHPGSDRSAQLGLDPALREPLQNLVGPGQRDRSAGADLRSQTGTRHIGPDGMANASACSPRIIDQRPAKRDAIAPLSLPARRTCDYIATCTPRRRSEAELAVEGIPIPDATRCGRVDQGPWPSCAPPGGNASHPESGGRHPSPAFISDVGQPFRQAGQLQPEVEPQPSQT